MTDASARKDANTMIVRRIDRRMAVSHIAAQLAKHDVIFRAALDTTDAPQPRVTVSSTWRLPPPLPPPADSYHYTDWIRQRLDQWLKRRERTGTDIRNTPRETKKQLLRPRTLFCDKETVELNVDAPIPPLGSVVIYNGDQMVVEGIFVFYGARGQRKTRITLSRLRRLVPGDKLA